VKDCLKELQTDMNKYYELAKNCYKKDLKRPVDCYVAEFGAIKYTEEEREEWEDFMKERAAKNDTSFVPANYPKVNMIVDSPLEKKWNEDDEDVNYIKVYLDNNYFIEKKKIQRYYNK